MAATSLNRLLGRISIRDPNDPTRVASVSAEGNLSVSVGLSSAGNGTVQTAATGTNFTALASQACKQVEFVNNTGTDVEVQQGGSGAAIPVFDGASFAFYGITNANQLGVRRVDTSNTQVTVAYRWGA